MTKNFLLQNRPTLSKLEGNLWSHFDKKNQFSFNRLPQPIFKVQFKPLQIFPGYDTMAKNFLFRNRTNLLNLKETHGAVLTKNQFYFNPPTIFEAQFKPLQIFPGYDTMAKLFLLQNRTKVPNLKEIHGAVLIKNQYNVSIYVGNENNENI